MNKNNELNVIMKRNSHFVQNGPRSVGSIVSTPDVAPYFYENLDMRAIAGIANTSFEWSIFSSLIDGMQEIFEWKGLPENINSGDLERAIISNGRVKFIKVGKSYKFVRIAPTLWNKNNDAVESRIVEPFLPRLTAKKTEMFDNVEIKNNQIGESLIRRIWPFLLSIGEQYRGIILNNRVLRGKALIELPELNQNSDFEVGEDGQTVQTDTERDNFNDWMTGEDPFKVVNKGMIGEMNVTPLNFENNLEAFQGAIGVYWNALLNTIGIPSNNVEGKQERLITGEIDIQNIIQNKILDAMLEYRKIAAKNINKTFNLNVSVDYDIKVKPDETKGENNGKDNNTK